MEYKKILKDMKKIVRETARYQLERFRAKDYEVETKSTSVDLVTEVDKESEKRILEYLTDRYPEIGYLAEEDGEIKKNNPYRFVLDPIDGTTNFAQGIPIFAISLALQKNEKGVIGVVYVPATREMFTAIKNEGAYLNGKQIKVSNTVCLEKSVLATGFSYSRATNLHHNLEVFNHFVSKVRGIRRIGSAAYDICNVARGSINGYWEMNLSQWDVAAGAVILKEAGGAIIYLEEAEGVSLVCGNDEIVSIIYKEISKYL